MDGTHVVLIGVALVVAPLGFWLGYKWEESKLKRALAEVSKDPRPSETAGRGPELVRLAGLHLEH